MQGGRGRHAAEPDASWRRWSLVVAAPVLVLAGAGMLGAAALHHGPPAQPALVAASAASAPGVAGNPSPSTSPSPVSPSTTAGTASPPQASVADPVTLSIPAIKLSSSLLHVGLAADGSIAVAKPGPDYDRAAWFTGSPRPGQVGPAVIEGHVDSAKAGPSVFYRIGELKIGDKITVARADGSTATFAVTGAQRYAKDDFPTLTVYGNTDDAQLRLITCAGSFDAATGHYRDNTVVYARQA